MKQGRTIALVAASALVVAGATTVALAWPKDETTASAKFYDPPVAAEPPGDAEPVAEVDAAGAGTTPVTSKALKPARATTRPVSLAPRDTKAASTELPEKATDPFSMVSITWTDPKDRPTGDVEVRTRSAKSGQWSGWQTLETEEAQAPQGAEAKGVRGGTGGIWVGESNAVAARVANTAGPLPKGLQLNLIDPGTAAPAAPKSKSGGQGGAAVPLPAYKTRAQWGADETLVKDPPEYGSAVKVFWVHHTAGSNTYACADAPKIIRSILTDQVKNRGWNDLGYNFMVDKCGVLYEGRKGGLDRPVIGAHTYGFNTDTSAVAVLGDYRTIGVPEVVKTVIARVAAAKLAQYNLGTLGSSQVRLGVNDNNKFPRREGDLITFPRISGHMDAVITECPGTQLYGQLPSIRTLAGGADGTLVLRAPTGGVANSGYYYVKNSVTMNWATTTPAGELSGFDVLVDGRVASSVGPEARSAPVTGLAPGVRKVQIRSQRTDGSSGLTPGANITADVAPPVFNPKLNVVLRNSTVSTSAVPMSATWKVTDNVKLGSIRMTQPSVVAFGGATTSYALTGKPGTARTYQMRAVDMPGNAAITTVARTPMLLADSTSTRSGTWTSKANSNYLNGRSMYAGAKGAKLTWSFTGTAAGVVVNKTTATGTFDVYVDGKKKAGVNTKGKSTLYRQMVWSSTLSNGKHTVQLVKTNTAGVFIDDLVYLK
ncbi:N-acetylmuramoyl-L-alanine amidase [Actinoplanes sp. NPDC089786]|uniref:N-acetylmuramoyl-L-alanine amidase n=1 Tax=Actinoplanes sp. NPDC089786 TaxID=3155185 RepID=UPI003417E0F2